MSDHEENAVKPPMSPTSIKEDKEDRDDSAADSDKEMVRNTLACRARSTISPPPPHKPRTSPSPHLECSPSHTPMPTVTRQDTRQPAISTALHHTKALALQGKLHAANIADYLTGYIRRRPRHCPRELLCSIPDPENVLQPERPEHREREDREGRV